MKFFSCLGFLTQKILGVGIKTVSITGYGFLSSPVLRIKAKGLTSLLGEYKTERKHEIGQSIDMEKRE